MKIGDEFVVDSGTNAPQEKKYFDAASDLIFLRAGHLSNINLDGSIKIEYLDRITQQAVDNLNLKRFAKNTVVFPKSGQSVNTNNIAWLPSDCFIVNHLACLYADDKVKVRYLYHLLKQFQISNFSEKSDYPSINLEAIRAFKIPLPPKARQEAIVKEINTVQQKEKTELDKFIQLNIKLNNLFSTLNYPIEKLGNIAEFKNGLNYSEKSTGDLVTIVGVKDFLEDFSPNLDKLVDVRIDGNLSETYKLKSGDILVVRRNDDWCVGFVT